MSPQPVDVLIFEDSPEQVEPIAHWFDLAPFEYSFSPRFVQASPAEGYSDAEAEKGWKWVAAEVERVDPKVVIFDYLLGKDSGADSFDGAVYGKACKQRWPEVGAVLVTTGGDGDQAGILVSQQELDDWLKNSDSLIDFAWIKPWGTAIPAEHDTKVRTELQNLIKRSRRPGNHRQQT